MLVLVISANLTPSGGIVDIDGATFFSDDLQETGEMMKTLESFYVLRSFYDSNFKDSVTF